MKKCVNVRVGMLLHAYELGLLEGRDLEQFELHALECEHCCHELSAAEGSMRLLKESRKVRAEIERDGALDGQGERAHDRGQGRAHIWITSRPLSMALAAMIVLLLYPAYLGLRGAGGNSFRGVQVLTLAPVRSQTMPILHKSPTDWATLTFVYPRAGSGERYKVEISNADGTVVFRDTTFGPFSDYSTAHLLLQVNDLQVGDYRLVLTDPHGNPALPEQQYLFRIAP
jgi:hypothetical protein